MDELELLKSELAKVGLRLDAAETAHVLKELEHLKAQSYDVRYGPLKSRALIPVDDTADPGAETITYDQYDHFGMAAVVANHADDIPLVDVIRKQFSMPVVTLASGYTFTVVDIERAAKARSRLIDRRAAANRMANVRREDEIGAIGVPHQDIPGFINSPNVSVVTLPDARAWRLLNSAEIVNNLNFIVAACVKNSAEAFTPDTLVLDPDSFGVISQKPVGTDNQMTILRSFLANNPYITDIEQWTRLTGAGEPSGTAATNRIICYPREPTVVAWNIPMAFRVLPPQAVNLAFKVPAYSRVSGVEWHYPIAAAYADIAQ